MSFSLSSLLNPSPAEGKEESQQEPAQSTNEQQQQQQQQQLQQQSPTQRRESLPSISYVQSPEMRHAQLPKYTPPQRPRPSVSTGLSSSATQLEAVTTSLDAQSQYTQTLSTERSNGAIDLPPPTSGALGERKMSSPTLEQYHHHKISHSPEQQRANALPLPSGYVLPPLQTAVPIVAGHEKQEELSPTSLLEDSSKQSHERVEIELNAAATLHVPVSTDIRDAGERHTITIKEEAAGSPQDIITSDTQRVFSQTNEQDNQSKTLSLLKNEHASRTQSPLRESSIALPTTEEASPNMTATRKRPPPKVKKGTATAAKRPRPSNKKRKHPTIKNGSNIKGVSAMSSPTPSDAQSAQADEYEDDDDSMADSDEDVEGSGDVYCICRKPDNGTFMIGCDGQCDDWFHGKCVSIEERDKNLIDKYICPRCAAAGVGRTSWKRMCRRQGCRLPARVGKNAGKNGATSKYCSDECGVLFFRQMTANARGAEQARKERSTRRKNEPTHATEFSGEIGARGGALSVGEVRAMLDQTNSAGEFRELGNGVLSPPATPSGNGLEIEDGMNESDRLAVETISTRKEEARQRHQLLKDRLKFITLVKNEASRAAGEKDLKPKEYCGFDTRLEWTEEDFAAWRQTKAGQQVFELDTIEASALDQPNGLDGVEADALMDVEMHEVCSRKKCARHTDWSKLAVDDVRFEMTDNSDRMRNLEQEEHDLRERAVRRAKARTFGESGGNVEIHKHAPDAKTTDNGVVHREDAGPMDIDNVQA